MGYQDTTQVSVGLATTASTEANFSSTVFVTTNAYMTNRLRAFTSMEAVREDEAIPSTSNAYQGLKLAFSVSGGSAVPLYLGRREWTELVLTPTVSDYTEYAITMVAQDSSLAETEYPISITSGVGATAEEITASIFEAYEALSPVGFTMVDNAGTLTVTKTAGYAFYMKDVAKLVDTYTTVETAEELLSALEDEGTEDFGFIATEDHTQSFVLEMASAVEATGTDNYPKVYTVAVQETTCITPLLDTANDTLSLLQKAGYLRTMAQWHDKADTNFVEVAPTAYNGKYTPGSTTYKFIPQVGGVTTALDPATGKELSKTKVGYILDRNASIYATERGIVFYHGGKTSSGEWIDTVTGRDYLVDQQETVLLNYFTNLTGSKSAFTASDRATIAGLIDGTLSNAVGYGFLNGYVPTSMPASVSFSDQASRILRNVKWTGYIAGAVHFALVDGILTYTDAVLE